jgi:hypothetical protein
MKNYNNPKTLKSRELQLYKELTEMTYLCLVKMDKIGFSTYNFSFYGAILHLADDGGGDYRYSGVEMIFHIHKLNVVDAIEEALTKFKKLKNF